MIDPVTGSMIVSGIGSALSALSGANQQRTQERISQQQANQAAAQNYQQMGMGDRQFGQTSNMNRQQLLDQRNAQAVQAQTALNLNPMRDRAAYMLTSRLGMPPGAFQPRDYTRGTMPGQGAPTGGMAPVMGAMQTAARDYRAGMGGMDTSALRAQLAGLQNQSQMPGLYEASTPDAMRYGAEQQQLQLDAANANYAQDRVNLQNRADRLASTLGRGQAAPQLLTAADRTQAAADAEKKAAANRRLMSMIGMGVGNAVGGLAGAGLGGLLGSRLGRG
jgi:hypothetical protein